MQQVLIFANPISGRGSGAAVAQSIEAELLRRGYAVRTFLSRVESVPWESGDIKAAVVIGGDGTLRGVAQWAIESATRLNQPLRAGCCMPYPLLIVPMGTANLMGKHLGIAWTEEQLPRHVADALERGRVVELDAASTDRGVFLLMAGIGVDAWIVHELDRLRRGKPIGGMWTYLFPGLRALAAYSFPQIEVFVDEKLMFPRARGLALVGNVAEYGVGFPILPYASPNDELLDVCVMPCASQADLLRLFIAAAGGAHVGMEGVVYLKGRRVRIESPDAVPVQVDGEPAGTTPVEIDLLSGKIPFIVPR